MFNKFVYSLFIEIRLPKIHTYKLLHTFLLQKRGNTKVFTMFIFHLNYYHSIINLNSTKIKKFIIF